MRDFHMPGRSCVFATEGLCATSHPLGAATAIDVLKQGGNAMDAAIAGAVVLGLCEPQMTGIGGDLFALWSDPSTGAVKSLNGSGRAPAGLQAETLRAAGHSVMPANSAHAATVPGAIDAFCHLSENVGTLPLDSVLAPAIHYAEAGIPVAPRVAFDWARAVEPLQGAARTHFLNAGKALEAGEVFRAPGQAEVLRRIAKDGRDAFYTGEIAEDMIATLNRLGGLHKPEDFAATTATPTDPIGGDYKSLTLLEHPPNSQGATANLILNILSHFDLPSLDPFGSARAHLEAEAAKLAYDARDRFIADMDYTTRLAHMTAPETAERLAALIDPKRAMTSARDISEGVHKETIYISCVDRDGMAVSLIYSIFDSFGSGIASDKFGILFHNRGKGFTLEEGHPNELAGGKRPMHTIIPGMLTRKGRVYMPFGVMGGAYQPNGHARFVTNLEDYGMDPQAAIDAPRCFSDKGQMKVERGYSETMRAELADLGHTVIVPDTPIGGAQAIRINDSGVLEGASDPRKDGCALGY